VLEAAHLVVVKRVKQEKLYFINTAPISAIVLTWLTAFLPPPAAQREATEPRASPSARGRGRRHAGSATGHGKWDPQTEVPLAEAITNMRAEYKERLRMRDS
jgi:hypothetical protein